MDLEQHAENDRQPVVLGPAIAEGIVVDPDVMSVAQRDRVVQRIPGSQCAIVWRPLRKTVVRVLERDVANDDVRPRHGGRPADIQPDSTNVRPVSDADDGRVRAGPDTHAGLLRELRRDARALERPARIHATPVACRVELLEERLVRKDDSLRPGIRRGIRPEVVLACERRIVRVDVAVNRALYVDDLRLVRGIRRRDVVWGKRDHAVVQRGDELGAVRDGVDLRLNRRRSAGRAGAFRCPSIVRREHLAPEIPAFVS